MNFYEELKLKRESSLEELRAGLDSIERVWHQRELIQPEKAQEMLNMVNEARSCFSTEESRKQYDDSLVSEKHENITDEEKERRDNFLKHNQMAYSFYQTKEYDLAVAEAEKAAQYLSEGDNSGFYGLTAEMCNKNGDYQKAVTFINKAILDNPKDPTLYITKGDILIQSELNQSGDKPADFGKGIASFERALTTAQDVGDLTTEGTSAAYLAYYKLHNSNPDSTAAKQFAKYALSIGDATGLAQRVINEIEILEKRAEKLNAVKQFEQMLLEEVVPSKSVYSIKYCHEDFAFKNVQVEGESIGEHARKCVIKTLSSFGLAPFDGGGMNRKFQKAQDYSTYKYKGGLMYYKPDGEITFEDEWPQVYLTADDRLIFNFRTDRLTKGNSNNEIALALRRELIAQNLAKEDSIIEPISSVTGKTMECSTTEKLSDEINKLKVKEEEERKRREAEAERKRREAEAEAERKRREAERKAEEEERARQDAESKADDIISAIENHLKNANEHALQEKLQSLENELSKMRNLRNSAEENFSHKSSMIKELNMIGNKETELETMKQSLGLFAHKEKQEIDKQLKKIANDKNHIKVGLIELDNKLTECKSFDQIDKEIASCLTQINQLREEIGKIEPQDIVKMGYEDAIKCMGNPIVKDVVKHKMSKATSLMLAEKGETVSFGEYTGAIEWLVLDVRDGRALLLSKYALDCRKYNEYGIDVTWETCSLRKWLNVEFFYLAFNDDEKGIIQKTGVPADSNPQYKSPPGNATQDSVFLLSVKEAERYFKDNNERMCAPTGYAVDNGAYVDNDYKADGKDVCWWWLRSPGSYSFYVTCVYSAGSINYGGTDVNNAHGCVRPALWIKHIS